MLCGTKKYEQIKNTKKNTTHILYGTAFLFFQYFSGLSKIFHLLNNFFNISIKKNDKIKEDINAKITVIIYLNHKYCGKILEKYIKLVSAKRKYQKSSQFKLHAL